MKLSQKLKKPSSSTKVRHIIISMHLLTKSRGKCIQFLFFFSP